MKLSLGLCYCVLLSSGKCVTFKLVGGNANGKVDVETPPGSGKIADLHTLLAGGYLAYWEVKCP